MSTRALDGGHGLHIYLNSASVCVAIKLKLSLFLILLLFFFSIAKWLLLLFVLFLRIRFHCVEALPYALHCYVGYFFSLCRVFKLKFSLLSFTLFYIFLSISMVHILFCIPLFSRLWNQIAPSPWLFFCLLVVQHFSFFFYWNSQGAVI